MLFASIVYFYSSLFFSRCCSVPVLFCCCCSFFSVPPPRCALVIVIIVAASTLFSSQFMLLSPHVNFEKSFNGWPLFRFSCFAVLLCGHVPFCGSNGCGDGQLTLSPFLRLALLFLSLSLLLLLLLLISLHSLFLASLYLFCAIDHTL